MAGTRAKGGDGEQGVTVGRLGPHVTGADQRAGAGAVFHEHLLAQGLAQLFGDAACHDVDIAARGERIDDAQRLDRVVLRGSCKAGGCQQQSDSGGDGA